MSHARQEQDYDTGARSTARLGLDDVRPVFKRLDNHFLGDTEHHGAGGEWRVEQPRVQWDVLNAVAKAAVEMGIPETPDFNTGDNTGVGYFHVNQKRGIRWSSARAFLKPVLARTNLRLETGVLVEKVIVEGGAPSASGFAGRPLVERAPRARSSCRQGASARRRSCSFRHRPGDGRRTGIAVVRHAGRRPYLQDLQQRAIFKYWRQDTERNLPLVVGAR